MTILRSFLILLLVGSLFFASDFGFTKEISQPSAADSLIQPPLEPIIDADIKVPLIDFKDVKVKDILIALAKTHGLNFWVSPEIIDIGSVYLENVLLVDALQFIVERYNLTYSKEGNIISFFQTKPVPIEIPTYVNCVDGKLTINVKDLLLNEFINMIIDSCGCNVVLEQGTSGVITGYLRDADFEQGLIAVLDANNLNLRRDENIYYISSYAAQERKVKRAFGINVDKNKVSLNVANVDLRSLIEDLASKLGLDIFIYGNIAGTVTASVKDLSSKNVFDYILNDTNYTYRVVDNVYFFGSSTLPEVNKSSLIKLENMKAENIIELILSWFSANWTFLV